MVLSEFTIALHFFLWRKAQRFRSEEDLLIITGQETNLYMGQFLCTKKEILGWGIFCSFLNDGPHRSSFLLDMFLTSCSSHSGEYN